jgi:cyclopropane fatty-acyl-phospholipid synthase-like methyltransferase
MLQIDESSWLKVWEKKGRAAGGKAVYDPQDLFAADGFDGAMAQTNADAQQHIARLITESLAIQPGMRVLEVGCGAGAVLSLLRSTQASFAGVDYSAPHLQIAGKVLPEMEFQLAEAAALPFPNGTFDAAFSYGVFLYFTDTGYASQVLREMLRVVRPGARILIQDVPDGAKRDACEHARRAAGASLNPPHCYYTKQFFADFAASQGRRAQIENQAVPGYANSLFRFNVLFY